MKREEIDGASRLQDSKERGFTLFSDSLEEGGGECVQIQIFPDGIE